MALVNRSYLHFVYRHAEFYEKSFLNPWSNFELKMFLGWPFSKIIREISICQET